MAVQTRFYMVMPQWLKDEIREISEKRQISMGELIKDILKKGIEEYKNNNK